PWPRLVPDRAHVVVAMNGQHVADHAVVNALDGLALGQVVAVAKTGGEADVPGLGELGRLDERADAWAIDGDGLFEEDVLALFNGVAGVHRAEMRRGGQQDQIAKINHLLVGIEADKLAIADIDLVGELLLKMRELVIDMVFESIANRVELHIGIGLQGFERRVGTTSTATDQADFESIASRGANTAGELSQASHSSGGRRLEECAAIGFGTHD